MSDSLIETAVRIGDAARDAGLHYRIELVTPDGGNRIKITSDGFPEKPTFEDDVDPDGGDA